MGWPLHTITQALKASAASNWHLTRPQSNSDHKTDFNHTPVPAQFCYEMWFNQNIWTRHLKKLPKTVLVGQIMCSNLFDWWESAPNLNQRTSVSPTHSSRTLPMKNKSRSSRFFSRSVSLNPLTSRLASAISTRPANPTDWVTGRRLITSEDEWNRYFLRQGLLGWWYCRCHLQNSCCPHRESQASSPGEWDLK